jgi:Tol biopolymer transport system component
MLAADGNTIAYNSASPNRVPGDTNGRTDVFVQNLQSPGIHRASVNSRGRQRKATSSVCGVSADGRVTAFYSQFTLAARDRRGLFIHDRTRAKTRRIYPRKGEPMNDYFGCSLSSDGRWLVFSSTASDLVRGDTNGRADVFIAGPLI